MRISTLSLLVPLLAQVAAQYGQPAAPQPENGGGEGGNAVHAPQGSTAAEGKPTAEVVQGYQPPFERGAAPQQETIVVGARAPSPTPVEQGQSNAEDTPHGVQRKGEDTPKQSPTPEVTYHGTQRRGEDTPKQSPTPVVTYHGTQRRGEDTPKQSPTPEVTYHGTQRRGEDTPRASPTPASNEQGTQEDSDTNDKGVLIATGEGGDDDDGKDQGAEKCKRAHNKRGPRRADIEA